MKEFMSKLTWVDYLAFFAFLRGAYVGYRSGFFPELLRILNYVLTLVLTFQFYEKAGQFITLNTFMGVGLASTIAFGLLLVACFFIIKFLIFLVLKLLKVGEGGVLGRLVGAAVGVCRWAMILSLLFIAIERSPLTQLRQDIRNRSMAGAKIAEFAPVLFDFLKNLSPQFAAPKKAL